MNFKPVKIMKFWCLLILPIGIFFNGSLSAQAYDKPIVKKNTFFGKYPNSGFEPNKQFAFSYSPIETYYFRFITGDKTTTTRIIKQ